MSSVDADIEDEPDLAPGTVLARKFRIESRLGRGGMGAVYRITHLQTQHPRALKVLRRAFAFDAEIIARLMREASVSGLLRSEAVVETLDAGILEDGSGYVMMELLEGEPLDAMIERGPVDPAWLVDRLGPACEALARAHDVGIVHRDLKPANLFVARRGDGADRLCLLDFGIAHFAQPLDAAGALTSARTRLGTPCYMAPEQLVSARDVDGRADVYALGVVLYEALSGVRPYDVESFADLLALVREARRVPLDVRRPGLEDALYELVDRALAIDPRERPTMRELGAALAALGPERARARPALDPVVSRDATIATLPTLPRGQLAPPRSRAPRARVLAIGVAALALVAAAWFVVPRAGVDLAPRPNDAVATSPIPPPPSSAPSTSAPSTSVPSISASSTSAPSISAPSISASSTSAPSISASSTSAPSISSAPSTSSTTIGAPRITAPAIAAPGIAADAGARSRIGSSSSVVRASDRASHVRTSPESPTRPAERVGLDTDPYGAQ